MVRRKVYEGLKVVDGVDLNKLYKKGKLSLKEIPGRKFYPNENLVLKSGPSGGALAIVKGKNAIKLIDKGDPGLSAMGIFPKNKEQAFALNMLMDPSIVAVTLTGAAGTGKSLMAVATGLEQAFGKGCRYTKLIYIKSIEPVGREIGHLPGSFEDKVDPYMGAIKDCLTICKSGKRNLHALIGFDDNSKIQKMPASFVRGRTFRKSFIIVDEAQNFSTHELKTILTRIDEKCKIVIVGDIDQADLHLKEENKGLIQVVEKFKDEELFGHINLIKSERSPLAQLVADKL